MSAGSDNLLSHTGESLELVNLRFSNGSLCPVPRPIEQKVLQQEYCQNLQSRNKKKNRIA